MHNDPNLILSLPQVWVLVIGALVPLVGYILNRFHGLSEAVKAGVHVVLAAGASALYTAIDTNVFGWNVSTLQLVLTAVIATLGAHHWLWKPSGVSSALRGAGSTPRVDAE